MTTQVDQLNKDVLNKSKQINLEKQSTSTNISRRNINQSNECNKIKIDGRKGCTNRKLITTITIQ